MGLPAPGKLPFQCVHGHLREKIQPAEPFSPALAHVPGHFKNHRPAEAVFRKLQFSGAPGKQLSVPEDLSMAVCPDALQPRNAAPVGFQLYQRGAELRAAVAKAPQQLVAGHAASQLRSREAAAGDNQTVARNRFLLGQYPEAVGGFLDFFYFKAQLHRDIRLFQGKPQNIHHGIGLIGIGVHPSGCLRHGE